MALLSPLGESAIVLSVLVLTGFPFLLAPISLPILGADFLAAHHLLADAHRCQVYRRLIRALTLIQ